MQESMLELIQLIKEGKSLNQICEITKLSQKQLFLKLSMLKNSGYLFEKSYNIKGDIYYQSSSPLKKEENITKINADTNISSIRMLVTSDAHYGSTYDNMKNAHIMREYATKEGIHLIFNTGDFFDGIYQERAKTRKYSSIEKTIYNILHDFPYDKNILNFLVLGNHDFSIWKNSGIDISYIIKERRHDIAPLGYGVGQTTINDFFFYLKHPITSQSVEYPQITNAILYKGHSHEFKANNLGNNFVVTVPSSSEERLSLGIIPSFLDIEYHISKDYNKIHHATCKQYILYNDNTYKISETTYQLNIPHKKLKKKQ